MACARTLLLLAFASGCHWLLPLGPGSSHQDLTPSDALVDGTSTPDGPPDSAVPEDLAGDQPADAPRLDSGPPTCFTLLAAGTGTVQGWESSFDGPSPGSYPTDGWEMFWDGSTNNTEVVDTQWHSSPHSFRLESTPTWKRMDGKKIMAKQVTGELMCYEAWVLLEQQPAAYIGFVWHQGVAGTGEYAGILVTTPNTWRHVMYLVDLANDSCTRYIAGAPQKPSGCGGATARDSFTHFVVGTQGGNGHAYFDDVKLYWVE